MGMDCNAKNFKPALLLFSGFSAFFAFLNRFLGDSYPDDSCIKIQVLITLKF